MMFLEWQVITYQSTTRRMMNVHRSSSMERSSAWTVSGDTSQSSTLPQKYGTTLRMTVAAKDSMMHFLMRYLSSPT